MHKRALVLGATLALAGSAFAGGLAAAAEMEMTPHPAHIHEGSCPAPGEVVVPLGEVSGQFLVDGTASMSAEPIGQATAVPVEASITTVSLPLADIAAAPHAIVVHKSTEEIGTYLVCGDIGGYTIGASDLPFGLSPVGDSGYGGIAWLVDNGDGTTTVNVFIMHAGAPMM